MKICFVNWFEIISNALLEDYYDAIMAKSNKRRVIN
ncbi:hypothetical protein DYY66_1661 [Candidatus Nitrosotalea sp. FS]|nr:hypothetical protein [Candidatus Nitrosotalea sp. FS]